MDVTYYKNKLAQFAEKRDRQWLCLFFIFFHIVWGINGVQAFSVGETYDSSNWEELKDRVPPPVLNWVKKGELILKTGKLNFEYKLCDDFLKSSPKNAGKFDIDEDGHLIVKRTGKIPRWCYGFPFPEDIDIRDPKASAKIMENFKFQLLRLGGYIEFNKESRPRGPGFENTPEGCFGKDMSVFERPYLKKNSTYQGRAPIFGVCTSITPGISSGPCKTPNIGAPATHPLDMALSKWACPFYTLF